MAVRTEEELHALYFSPSGIWAPNGVGAISANDLQSGVLDTYDTLKYTSSVNPQNETFVSLNGDDTTGDGSFNKPYRTIKYANDSIVGASPTNRHVINIAPGWYNETNPITTQPYVNLVGASLNSTVIVANENDNCVNLSESTLLSNVGLIGAPDHTALYIGGSGVCAGENIAFFGGKIGVHVDNPNASPDLYNLVGIGTDLDSDFVSVTSGKCSIRDLRVPDISAYNTVLCASGVNSTLHVWRVMDESINSKNGICLYDNCTASIKSGRISDSQYGLYTEDSDFLMTDVSFLNCGSGMYVNGGSMRSYTTGLAFVGCHFDIRVKGSGVLGFQGLGNSDKVDIDNELLVVGSFVNGKAGDEGLSIIGELHVGTQKRPSESTFGGGDSYNDDMLVYISGVNTGIVDVTDIAKSYTGSTFPLPDKAGDGLYICSTKPDLDSFHKFHGIKIDIAEPVHASGTIQYDASVTGGTVADGNFDYLNDFNDEPLFSRDGSEYYVFHAQGYWCMYDSYPPSNFKRRNADYISITLEGDYSAQNGNTGTPQFSYNERTENPDTWEYYNSVSGWLPFSSMGTRSEGRYLQTPEVASIVGKHQIRFDARLNDTFEWDEVDLFNQGTSYYWIRATMGDDLTDPGAIQQIKLHTSRTEINKDGFIEYFGKGRPIGKLPWTREQIQPTAIGNLGDVDLFFSDNIALGGDENDFGTDDSAGFATTIPDDFDTSTPIVLSMSFRAAGNGTTNYNINWTYAEPGSNVYTSTSGSPSQHPNERSMSSSITVSSNQIVTVRQLLSFSGAIARRENAPGDIIAVSFEKVSGPNLALIDISGRYLKWCNGGHIGG